MDMSETAVFPGSDACAEEVFDLASEYHRVARTLFEGARNRRPGSDAPARLCALHAIELYLNAFLLHLGEPAEQIRARKHDFAKRAKAALDGGLKLRKKTAEHLVKLSDDREYLVSRYDPELSSTLSPITRLEATLEEVAKKVRSVAAGPDAAADLA